MSNDTSTSSGSDTVIVTTDTTSSNNYTLHYPGHFTYTGIGFDNKTIDALFENEHFIKKLKQFMFKETLEKL